MVTDNNMVENNKMQRIYKSIDNTTTKNKGGVVTNLPANRFGFCLRRGELENDIIDGIRGSESIILLYGQGGLGKSASVYNLMVDIAKNKIEFEKDIDKIFWFSDADMPGTLSISKVIDDIKFTCGISVSSQAYNSSNELNSIFNVFNNTKMSIIVFDNFETIKDKKLISHFLYHTPMWCKIVIVSKYNTSYYRNNNVISDRLTIKEIKAPKFNFSEWKKAFDERCESNKTLKAWANNLDTKFSDLIMKEIHTKLDGNIFAMMNVVSIFAKKGITEYNEINDELNEAQVLEPSFNRTLSNSWNLISENAKSVLIASTVQGNSYIDFCFVEKISEIHKSKGEHPKTASDLDKAVTECVDLNLMESEIIQGHQKYYISSIVHSFISFLLVNEGHGEKAKISIDKQHFKKIIDNWINHYIEISNTIGFCYNNTKKMQFFDLPANRESLMFVLEYCFNNERYNDYVEISGNLRYFFYTRAIWSVGEECIHIKRALAARRNNDFIGEFDALLYYLNIAFKYCLVEGTEKYFSRVEELRSQLNISKDHYPENFFRYKHVLGLYYYAMKQFDLAMEQWDDILPDDLLLDDRHFGNNELHIHDIDAAIRWKMKAFSKQSKEDPSVIIMLCEKYLTFSKKHNFERGIVDYSFMIVNEYVGMNNTDKALEKLKAIENYITTVNDLVYTVRYYLYLAFCYGDNKMGQKYLKDAQDLQKDGIYDSSCEMIIKAMKEKNMFNGLLENSL